MDIHITVSGVRIGNQEIGNSATVREIVSAIGNPAIRSCQPPNGSHPEMAVSVLDEYGVLVRHRKSDGALGLLEVFLASSRGQDQPKKSFPGAVWFDGLELVRPLRFSAIPTAGNFGWSCGSAVSSVLSISFHPKLEFVGSIVVGWRSSVFRPSSPNNAFRTDSASTPDSHDGDNWCGACEGKTL